MSGAQSDEDQLRELFTECWRKGDPKETLQLWNCQKGDCSEVGISLLSQATGKLPQALSQEV